MSSRNMKVVMVRGPRQNLRKQNGSARRSSVTDPALILRPSFKGQYVTVMKLPTDPSVISTTVATGVIAATQIVQSTSINNFVTRFATFEDYRIVKAIFKIRCFSTTNPGVGAFWIDDSSALAVPTSVEAQQRQGVKKFPLSAVNTVHTIEYVPHSPTEQNWNPISTNQVLSVFKLYSDNANFASSIVATQYCEIESEFTVQFRGVM